jgi:DNA-binding SARP family transcriptional activator
MHGAGPHVTGLVRPRLAEVLDRMADSRIGVVTAPAGSGKTALLAQWAASTAMTTIWCGSTARGWRSPLLRRLAHGVSVTAGSEPQSYDELVRATFDYAGPVVLVVDDLDSTGGTPATLERFLLDSSPQVRLLVSSTRRLRFNPARSELPAAVVVTGADLRFRTFEVEQLFRRIYRQPLTPAGVQNLVMRTDGWAACLHLFHLSLAGRHPGDERRAAECLGDRLGFAADYLTHHVLRELPDRLRDLLESTSLFDVLTPRLCDAVCRTRSSRVLLLQLEDAGLLERDGDDEVYRVPRALRHHLRYALINDASHADWPGHCASAAEASGHIDQALRIRAETGNWDGLLDTLRRAGGAALQPGGCGWSALVPDEIRAEPLTRLAEARRLLDDGALVASAAMAASVRDQPSAEAWHEAASGLLARSTVWADDTPSASPDAFAALCAAMRSAPGDVARSLRGAAEPEPLLAAALASLLGGDQRAALPLLRQCAGAMNESPFVALAAQLALIVVAADQSSWAAMRVADELDAVRRTAEDRGYTWLARLASGLAAAGSVTTSRTQRAASAPWDDRGDPWGAAIVLAAGALKGLVSGRLDPGSLEVLADRFRVLRASVPEAWARAALALAAAQEDEPDAVVTARAAVSFARLAGAPGALALAYAAWGMCDRDLRGELMILAGDTAREYGLLCRPWTRLAAEGPTAEPTIASEPRPVHVRLQPEIEVRCFGGFSLRTGGTEVDLSRIRPQARTVLRILAIHRGHPVHRDVLIEALWGNLGGRAAMHMLQVSVSALRRVLSVEGQDAPGLVSRDGEAYALATASSTTLDLVEFDTALHDAAVARSTGDAAGEITALRRTAQLYLGDLLPEDGSSEWIVDTREAYRLRAGEAASSLARLELELGNRAAAETAAVRSIEIDPYRDESWRVLIGMFEHAGDIVAARRAQQRYQSVLATLGVTEPDSGSRPEPDVALFQPAPRTPTPLSPLQGNHRGAR